MWPNALGFFRFLNQVTCAPRSGTSCSLSLWVEQSSLRYLHGFFCPCVNPQWGLPDHSTEKSNTAQYLNPPLLAPFPALFSSTAHTTTWQTFSLLLCLLWWTVINDLACYYVTDLGCHEPHPHKTGNQHFNLQHVSVFDCPTDQPSPSSLPLSPETQQYQN